MLVRTKVLTTAVALLTITLVTLPTAQGQANANEIKLKIEAVLKVSNQEILDTAKQYIGTPYCWGGETARCFDCSGFIQYVYNKNGIEVSRTADEQLRSMTIIPRDEAQEGDLVFFVYRNGYAHHVGIYVGNNMILHSPRPGKKVRLEEIWSTRVVFARDSSTVFLIPSPVEVVLEEPKTEDGITY